MQAFRGKLVELGEGHSADQKGGPESPPDAAPRPLFGAPYDPADDTFCWVCQGPVTKRHCKIICLRCGFTRDCSDP